MAHISLNYKSQSLVRNISLEVFLPYGEGLPVDTPPYKTFYFLPGFSGSAIELATYLSFRKQSLVHNIAVVIVNGDNSFYIDKSDRMAMYSTFITKELLEVTRDLLPLSDKKEDTFIGGLSMGGYGSLINGLQHTDTFGKIAMLSPGIDFYKMNDDGKPGFTQEFLDDIFNSREEHQNSLEFPEKIITEHVNNAVEFPDLFLTCGTEDELTYDDTVYLFNLLKENNIEVEYIEDTGNHDIFFWEKMMTPMFSFLAK